MGDYQLPPLTGDQIRDMLKGPQLQRPLDTRPGQCTKDDPQGVAHNGTQGRVYTQYVTSRDPADDKKAQEAQRNLAMCMASPFGCAPAIMKDAGVEVQSYKGKVEWGPFKGGYDSDKGPTGGVKGPKEGADGKKKYSAIPKVEGEVCIVRSSDPKAKTGEWGNIDWKLGPLNGKVGLNGGPLCYGFSTEKAGLDLSYTPK